MKFHVTMLRTVETLDYVLDAFSDKRQVQILKCRTHHRRGTAYMVVTFEGPDDQMTRYVIEGITLIRGVERLVRDDYVDPEPPDFKRCQNAIIVTPFSSEALVGRCANPPVWIARNKPLDRKKRVAVCQSCKEQIHRILPLTTFQKI